MGEELNAIEVPQCGVGAPLPHVFANEDVFIFAYRVQTPKQPWVRNFLRSVAPTTKDEHVAVLTAERCLVFQFGPPNDEAIAGHRLYSLGLESYSAFEVLNSTWIDDLEKANRVHRSHTPGLFSGYRHFVFTFQDSTLEFVADSFSIDLRRRSVLDSLMDAARSYIQE